MKWIIPLIKNTIAFLSFGIPIFKRSQLANIKKYWLRCDHLKLGRQTLNNTMLFLINGIIFLIALSACQVGPKYEPPVMEVPCSWQSPLSEGMQVEPPECSPWWGALNDPILNDLIETASLQNLDVFSAASRVLEAREGEKGGRSPLLPRLDGSLTYGHAQFNQRTLSQILGTHQHSNRRRNVDLFEVGFDASWEIDLFGMHVHELNALRANTEAVCEDFDQILLSLTAEVAKNYIELRGLQERLDVLNKEIAAQKEMLQLREGLSQTGFISLVDQRTAEEELSTLEAKQPALQFAIQKTIFRLAVLLGCAPGELVVTDAPLPCLPIKKQIGVPSELLRRRSDIRKAERDLAAATHRIGSAMAAYFPRLSLQGFIGDLTNFSSGSFAAFGGSQLLLPLFNSKLIEQDIEINKLKTEQALYAYQKTVLEALEETESVIAAFHFELRKNQHLSEAKSAGREAYELTHQLYQRGLKNYLEV